MPKNKHDFIQLFYPSDLFLRRKGEYIVEHGTAWYLADLLMRCIADEISRTSIQPAADETSADAVKRFKVKKGYVEVLDYFMSQMDTEIMPALQRLHQQFYGEGAEE